MESNNINLPDWYITEFHNQTEEKVYFQESTEKQYFYEFMDQLDKCLEERTGLTIEPYQVAKLRSEMSIMHHIMQYGRELTLKIYWERENEKKLSANV